MRPEPSTRPLLLAAASAAVLLVLPCCEQRFSANPPELPPEPSGGGAGAGAGGIEALLAPRDGDAGAAAAGSTHAMVITLCSAMPAACEGAPEGTAYHVVYGGSGRGVLRSREQTVADLYKELRDRTSSAERLLASPRSPRDGGAPVLLHASSAKASERSGDALAQSAQHLVDVVDGVGELALDVLHGPGECLVALGRAGSDAGAQQCLIQSPERPHAPAGRGGIPF